MRKVFPFLICAAAALSFQACKKSSETFQTTAIAEYAPLVPGKYVSYAMDSLVYYTNFNASQVTISYQVKYQVDAAITDNLGRPAYRIFRYIRKTPAQPWVPDATFTGINTGDGYEFIENNYRYIKLKQPIREGFSWKGNTFIDTRSINSEVKYLDDWDYVYANVDQPAQVGSYSLDSTLTVEHRDDSLNHPITAITNFADKTVSREIYAKGIGMVYRYFLHYEYQGVNRTYNGYGVRYTMIDHN
ncbi:MAG: hypothetical protein EOP54_21420 [Sphingobacteriales bacterium]|nr:MAG: hypothetical protein EOP54_21420 [Sphingobacteriales bacterium]